MTEFPKKKFADHDTTDEMAMLGYGYNLAIDDYQKAIRDNLPTEEEISRTIYQELCVVKEMNIGISSLSAAISKLYKDRLNLGKMEQNKGE